MEKVAVKLFASPSLVRGDVPVTLPRKKSLALLAILACGTAPHARAALGSLLWPSLGHAGAKAALRSALWDLQETLGEGTIVTSRQALACGPDADIDVVEMRRALELAAAAERGGRAADMIPWLERAVVIYRGDFLQGFSLPAHAAFTEWQSAQAETLRAARFQALARLVDLCETEGDIDRAIVHAERMLGIDPLDPAAHRRVIRLYLDRGDRPAALERYARCVRILAEHHREPDAETRALYDAARGATKAGPPPQESWPPASAALPAVPTPLLGRATDLACVLSRLREPHGRIVTVTGPGGIGKTRLASAAAQELAASFADGVRFVPLASVTAPEHVPLAVAVAASTPRAGASPEPPDTIAALRDREMLLVLDGFEHLLGAASWLADLLARAPRVRILATSRERLHLRGEHEVPLAGLPHAAPSGVAPAIELFVQSATRAHPSFSASPGEAPQVARICELLGGIPLGIELAAAWVHHYGVAEIARRIEGDLDFLMAPRDAPESHRSLRATFARSWALLAPEGQAAFSNLSVFLEPFDERAAAAVAGANGAMLASLGTKFFLHRVTSGRYSLHPVLRRFAAEELSKRPDEERRTAGRYRAYFVDLCASLSADLSGSSATELARRIAESRADVRGAFAAAVSERAWGDLDRALFGFFTALEIEGQDRLAASVMEDAARALRAELATATRGRAVLRRLLGRVLARKARAGLEHLPRAAVADTLAESLTLLRRTSATADLCYALNADGRLAAREGDLATARARFREALRIRKATGDRRGMAIGYNNLSVIACSGGDYAKAERLLRRSLRIFRAIDDRRSTVACLSSLGDLLHVQGDLDGAERAVREGLAMGREAGDPFAVAMLHVSLGRTLLDAGRPAEADVCFADALAIGRSASQDEAIATALLGVGTTARLLGDLDRAERSLAESMALFRELGVKPGLAEAQAALGLVLAARRRPAEARAALLEALQRASDLGAVPLLLDVLAGIAEARAFGAAHAVETAEIILSHPGASRAAARRAHRIVTAIGSGARAARREDQGLADIVGAMLATRA